MNTIAQASPEARKKNNKRTAKQTFEDWWLVAKWSGVLKNKQVYSKQISHSNDLLQERIHRKETKTWQRVFNKLVTNIQNEHKTFFHKPCWIVTSILFLNIRWELKISECLHFDFLDLFPNLDPFSLKALYKTTCHIQSVFAL